MRRDYSYSYEWDREYCYPNSNVLINKLNIQDADALHTAEREITSLRLAAAKMHPIKGKFHMRHLQKTHEYLFGDIYDWAGKLRHVNIAKSNSFCLAMNLEIYGNNLFQKLEREHYLIGSTEFVPHRLAYYFSEINVLHPFREGNGRTQRLFVEYLASVAGYRVDFSQVSTEEMMIASADSFACEYGSINRMFERVTTPISEEEQKENIRFFWKQRKATHMTAGCKSVTCRNLPRIFDVFPSLERLVNTEAVHLKCCKDTKRGLSHECSEAAPYGFYRRILYHCVPLCK